jgi:uncharacterized membrane protein
MISTPAILATLADSAAYFPADLLLTLAVVLVVCGAGLVIAYMVKRWSRREHTSQTFTLQDLRELRDRGDITDPEYVALRTEILGRAGRQLDQDP